MTKVRNILHRKDKEYGAGRSMRPFGRNMEDFFGNGFPRRWMEGFFEPHVWRPPFWSEFSESFDVWPKVDILDRDDRLLIRAEMPGIRKDDLEITIAGDRLTLEAKREFDEKEEKDNFFHSEIGYGRVYRIVHLPVEVKGDEAKAEMKDGVVEIYLPKVEATTPRSIKVA